MTIGGSRPQARISKSALRDNLAALKQSALPGTLFGPIIKANAYGHGRDLVASALLGDVDLFTVAEPFDAIGLSKVAPGRVVCLGTAYGEELAELLHAGVRVTVTSAAALSELGPGARVHLLVDTGLHRLGVAPESAVELAAAIRKTGATLEGLFCHVAGADREDWPTVEAEIQILRRLPIDGVIRHAGGSSLVIARPDLVGDLARPGMSVYGHCPHPRQRSLIGLRQALTLVAPIIELRHVNRGDHLGYAAVPISKDTIVATLAIGVCHGLDPRWAENYGYVNIRNVHCPLLAAPMLDYTLVDVSGVPGVAIGDMATILGGAAGEHYNLGLSVEAVAERLNETPEHVVVGIHECVPRVLTP